MKGAVVVDTNVCVVANGRHDRAGPGCVEACIEALAQARRGLVVIDDAMRILDEYRRNVDASGQPGVGDAFFRWLWSNQANRRRCRQVRITAATDDDETFAEFPRDPELAGFDRSDRKFVAVALASGLDPHVDNASDSDWWIFRDPLEANGVRVRFLCPELMQG